MLLKVVSSALQAYIKWSNT